MIIKLKSNTITTQFDCKGKIYITSDLHYGHANIIKYCHQRHKFLSVTELNEFLLDQQHYKVPQAAVERMNDEIISNINAVVNSNDYLIILGDIAFSLNNFKKCLGRINCQNLIIIWGNHDPEIARPDIYCIYSADYAKMLIDNIPGVKGKTEIILSHYALDKWEDSEDSYHVYGHSHTNADKERGEISRYNRSKDVGIDGNSMKPWELSNLLSILSIIK